MQESSLVPSWAVAPCALWGAPHARGAPKLGTAHKILGGAMQGGRVRGVFAAEIRAAPGWVTSSWSIPPCGDDGRRDCRALRHRLPDPAGDGERQKP